MGLMPQSSSGSGTPLVVHAGSFSQAEIASHNGNTLTANRVYWHPITIPFDYVVNRMAWCNGWQSNATRNINMGVYSSDGTKLFETGVTTFTTPPQNRTYYATLSSPMFLPRGSYYLAFRSSTTTLVWAWSFDSAGIAKNLDGGLLEQTQSGTPTTLPNDMTSAIRQSTEHNAPIVGLLRT
jgi:hypothetical protein